MTSLTTAVEVESLFPRLWKLTLAFFPSSSLAPPLDPRQRARREKEKTKKAPRRPGQRSARKALCPFFLSVSFIYLLIFVRLYSPGKYSIFTFASLLLCLSSSSRFPLLSSSFVSPFHISHFFSSLFSALNTPKNSLKQRYPFKS